MYLVYIPITHICLHVSFPAPSIIIRIVINGALCNSGNDIKTDISVFCFQRNNKIEADFQFKYFYSFSTTFHFCFSFIFRFSISPSRASARSTGTMVWIQRYATVFDVWVLWVLNNTNSHSAGKGNGKWHLKQYWTASTKKLHTIHHHSSSSSCSSFVENNKQQKYGCCLWEIPLFFIAECFFNCCGFFILRNMLFTFHFYDFPGIQYPGYRLTDI